MTSSSGRLSKALSIIPFVFLISLLSTAVIPVASAAHTAACPVIEAYFFYGDGCVHCANIEPHIADLASGHPDLRVRYFEVYHNSTNQDFFATVISAYGIKSTGVPVLIIGNRAMIGESRIREEAGPLVLELEKAGLSVSPRITITPSEGDEACPPATSDLTLPVVISSALIDSVNPCAFAVLVFLLLSIITLESRRRVLMVGGAYITAVFVFYLLSGIGLFIIVQGSGFSGILFNGAAILSIILGIVNIVDVIRKNEGFILAIPASKKEVIDRYIHTATLPGAFILGILVGIFELPCTGGIYLAILSMMSETYTFSQGLPYLVLYNLIFILPLIVILLIVSFGLSPERVNSWRLEKRRLLRLAIGIAMVVLGAVMLSGIL